MCEGYWDKRLSRWVSLEELEEEEIETLTSDLKIELPPPAAEPKRRPALLLR